MNGVGTHSAIYRMNQMSDYGTAVTNRKLQCEYLFSVFSWMHIP